MEPVNSLEKGHGAAHLLGLLVIFPLLALTVMAVTPLDAASAQTPASSATASSVDQYGNALNSTSFVYTALYGPTGSAVAAGLTAGTFATAIGSAYTLQAYGFGSCTFSSWSGGVSSAPMQFTANSTAASFTAVYNCKGAINANTGTITIYDHRMPQSDWAQCFALVCSAGTGPGASMWVALYNSAGTVVATGFSNENGLTFSGLNPTATYYIYPSDCDLCHTSTHDVLFNHWGDGSTTRPLPVIANNASLNAYYDCTNTCGGV